jgi:putative thioredoxin
MGRSAYVLEVDEQTFQREVLDRSKEVPVVVDFWAAWCGPCRALTPILERLIDERQGRIYLAKVNVDENPYLAQAFRIEGIPAIKAIRDGKIVAQFEGLIPESQLAEFLDRLLPSPAADEVQQAAAIESSNPMEAARLYARALSKDPDFPPAILGMARIRLATGELDEAEYLANRVPPGGEHGAEADRIRAILRLKKLGGDLDARRQAVAEDPENVQKLFDLGEALAAAGQYPEALQSLYAAAERDKEMARGPVKELMVQIFHVIGQRSDLAEEYRDKLRRVMY